MSNTPELDRLAGRLVSLEEQVRRANTPQLGHSAIRPGGAIEQYNEDGTLVQVIGKQPDGSNGVVEYNGGRPPKPVAPSVEVITDAVRVIWDGRWEAGHVAPLDLLRIDVHITEEAMTDPLTVPASATISAAGWGMATLPVEPGDYFVHLVAWTKSGKFSVSDVSEPFLIHDSGPTAPPGSAPMLQVEPFAMGMIRASWGAVDDALQAKYEVAMSLSPTVREDGTDTVATVDNTMFDAAMISGQPLPFAPVYVKVRAKNSLGAGPWSEAKSATPRQIESLDVADFSITVKKLHAPFHMIY